MVFLARLWLLDCHYFYDGDHTETRFPKSEQSVHAVVFPFLVANHHLSFEQLKRYKIWLEPSPVGGS